MTEPSTPPATTPLILPQARVEDVFQATEEVRASDFPTVPAELLAAVLAAERDNPESRPVAARAVARAVDDYLVDHPAKPDTGPGGQRAVSGGTVS